MSSDQETPTPEDYRAMYEAAMMGKHHYRDMWLKALAKNAVLQRVVNKILELSDS